MTAISGSSGIECPWCRGEGELAINHTNNPATEYDGLCGLCIGHGQFPDRDALDRACEQIDVCAGCLHDQEQCACRPVSLFPAFFTNESSRSRQRPAA